MGGVRSSGWAGLLALASVAVVSCGRTSQRGGVAGPVAGAPTTPEPQAESGIPDCARALAGNGGRFCGIYGSGTVWCFGTALEPKPSSFAPSAEPVLIESAPSGNSIVVGPRHSCVVTGRGEIVCWGDNESGQIDDSRLTSVEGQKVSLVPEGFTAIKGLGLLEQQTCAVDVMSHVFCRGTDSSGLHGGPQQIKVAGQMDTTMPGANTTTVLDERGRAFTIANWHDPQLDTSVGLDNARVFYGGPTCVLKRWGSLWCTDYMVDATGLPLHNVLALGENVVDAGVGDLFMCALTHDGRVWCEGLNVTGQTATGANSTFAEGHFVDGLQDVRALAVAHSSVCVIQGDGSVWCWGAYADGHQSNLPQLVTGCTQPSLAPARPTAAFVSAPRNPAQRLGEAGRARGQAVCLCGPPALEREGCIDEESPGPNASCVSALIPQDAMRWECRAEQFWTEAKCLFESGCPLSAGKCLPAGECPDSKVPLLERYCSRRQCASNPDSQLFGRQICDGVRDCADGTDERNCTAHDGAFECDTGAVPISLVCNGRLECPDGSDEAGCP